MSVNGISGYSSYNYQNMANMIRLSGIKSQSSYQAVAPVKKTGSVKSGSTAYDDIAGFLKSYQSKLTSLESAAAKLQESSRTNVFTDYEAASTDESVATVSGTYRLRGDTNITLDVHSLAQAQQNVSGSHYSQETVEAGADMKLEIAGAGGSASISVSSANENGTAKTYNQMYQEAAKAINSNAGLGVKASVSNVEGKVSLVLTARDTGADNGFTVSGSMGAAGGLENASTEAQDAVYTVNQDGFSYTRSSQSNKVSLDYGRMEAELKSEGTTKVYTGVDTDKVADAVEDLVDSYNSVTKLLGDNAGRGTGTASHLSSFNRGMADEKTLNAIGITYNKDGSMELDKEKLVSALEKDYEGTKSLIAGQFGIAEKAAARADSALSDSVQRIVGNDLSSAASQSQNSGFSSSGTFQYFSNFARSGPYNLANYYTVGMMLNTLA